MQTFQSNFIFLLFLHVPAYSGVRLFIPLLIHRCPLNNITKQTRQDFISRSKRRTRLGNYRRCRRVHVTRRKRNFCSRDSFHRENAPRGKHERGEEEEGREKRERETNRKKLEGERRRKKRGNQICLIGLFV